MYLLDTSVLSHAQYSRQHPAVGAWLGSQEKLAIPFPAILEIYHGITSVRTTKPLLAAEIASWLDDVLSMGYFYPEVNREVARVLAILYGCDDLRHLWYIDPDNSRRRKPGQDLFIAAISIAHDIPIATLDAKDFVRIHRQVQLPGVYNPAFSVWLVEERIRETLVNRSYMHVA